MGTEIATRIAKPKRKETVREEIKRLASQHSDVAIKRLRELADNKSGKVPANAQVAAANALLDRSAGKPRFADQDETAGRDEFDRMDAPALLQSIVDAIPQLSAGARAAIAEALIAAQHGLTIDVRDFVDEAPIVKQKREPRR